MEPSEDLLPKAKRPKLSREHSSHGQGTEDVEKTPASRHSLLKAEFPLLNLEDFYKPCPNYRLPMEIGAFSINGTGELCLDRSQLRYYAPPGRLNLDLNVGFNSFVPKKENVPADRLQPILKWISSNGNCFRPKSAHLKSPDKNGEVDSSSGVLDSKDRPDNILTNFVTWRGMVTKMLCSPYNKSDPWKVAATLHNSTIYLSEIETEEAKQKTANQTDREKQWCYWGVKFEDYMTVPEPPTPSKPLATSTSTPTSRTGTVNPHKAFCTVVRTRMNTHSIVMAAEVDCCDNTSKEKPPQNYVELKTNRALWTDRNKTSFKRYKLMKFWAQSFLVGVPRIVVGFRDDEGTVNSLQTFKTTDIPNETQNDLGLWQPSVCLNFLDELLTWIRKRVIKDDPRVVYILEWGYPFSCVTCTECPPGSEYTFLPDWYINKLPPPSN